MAQNSSFFSKILLFGEYSIMKKGMALSIPFDKYKGHLEIKNPSKSKEYIESNKKLKDFAKYLQRTFQGDDTIDLERLKDDLDKGLYFKSNIPIGYGVGSSGAVVAAIYTRYAHKKIDSSDIEKLKNLLAKMESFFHEKSSGIDPLICYLKHPLLINSKQKIEKLPDYDKKLSKGKFIFLINSKIPRKSTTMVDTFFKKIKNDKLYNSFLKFVHYNNACINSLLGKDINSFFSNIEDLSLLFLEKFSHMIPSNMYEIWKIGIKKNLYYLKLCGAGGGGYMIGFTKNFEQTKKLLFEYNLIPLHKL